MGEGLTSRQGGGTQLTGRSVQGTPPTPPSVEQNILEPQLSK